MAIRLGRTLVVVNPFSHSGEAGRNADLIERVLSDAPGAQVEIRFTEGPDDGRRFAADSAGYDSVVGVGGDGLIHGIANGLMQLDEGVRPRLGVIPFGSGNDFSRTIRIPRNNPESSVRALLAGHEEAIDLGIVNGHYFIQTLSFGLDAAIALDVNDRKSAGDSSQGGYLFASSALRTLRRRNRGWDYSATFDDIDYMKGTELIFACQIGPTYGGGVRICPDASNTDGLIDVCYSVGNPPIPVVLGVAAMAKFGMHSGAKSVGFRKIRKLHVTFAEEPPCQMDGEKLVGATFDVGIVPQALHCVVGS